MDTPSSMESLPPSPPPSAPLNTEASSNDQGVPLPDLGLDQNTPSPLSQENLRNPKVLSEDDAAVLTDVLTQLREGQSPHDLMVTALIALGYGQEQAFKMLEERGWKLDPIEMIELLETVPQDLSREGNEASPFFNLDNLVVDVISDKFEEGLRTEEDKSPEDTIIGDLKKDLENPTAEGAYKRIEDASEKATRKLLKKLGISDKQYEKLKDKPFFQMIKEAAEKGEKKPGERADLGSLVTDLGKVSNSFGKSVDQFLEKRANVGEFIRFLAGGEYFGGLAHDLGYKTEEELAHEGIASVGPEDIEEYTKGDPKSELSLITESLYEAKIITETQYKFYEGQADPSAVLQSETFKNDLEKALTKESHEHFAQQIVKRVKKDPNAKLSKEGLLYIAGIPYKKHHGERGGEAHQASVTEEKPAETPSQSAKAETKPEGQNP